MRKVFLALLSGLAVLACNSEIPSVSIVPNPVQMTVGRTMASIDHNALDEAITVRIDTTLAQEEYELAISRRGIKVKAGSDQGAFWARQTLTQIASQSPEGKLPCLVIKDKPAFSYRGAMLDCCRHFWTVDEVKTWIDMIALHKINVFHWHLTEDQGWRIEIKKYPRLTEYGSIRKETKIDSFSGEEKYDGIPYGGFYTQDDIRDIVAYAAERHITVIPEIEMPGHSIAALACYPELGCTGGPYEVRTAWGISNDVFCIGKEKTFEFLQNVLDEVCELFPGEYIHIGGDEAPRVRWSKCRDCQKRIKAEGLENEAQLQSYLVNRIEKYLNDKGRKIIGWDEILEGGVSKTATVMSWRGSTGGINAAKLGNDVIMAANSHFYFDNYQTSGQRVNGEPFAHHRTINLRKCYSFDPFDQLDEDTKHHIRGMQANTWTEHIATFDHVMHMDLPRMAALAEVAWSPVKTSYEDFLARIEKGLLPVYTERGYNYATYAFEGLE